MKVHYTEPMISCPPAQVEFGESTWDPNEKSVRARFTSANGGFSRGSPEVPMHCLSQMYEVAATKGGIPIKDVARLLFRLMAKII